MSKNLTEGTTPDACVGVVKMYGMYMQYCCRNNIPVAVAACRTKMGTVIHKLFDNVILGHFTDEESKKLYRYHGIEFAPKCEVQSMYDLQLPEYSSHQKVGNLVSFQFYTEWQVDGTPLVVYINVNTQNMDQDILFNRHYIRNEKYGFAPKATFNQKWLNRLGCIFKKMKLCYGFAYKQFCIKTCSHHQSMEECS